MNYYVMQTALASGSKPQLVQWAKTQADAGESPEWIRSRIGSVIEKAKGQL